MEAIKIDIFTPTKEHEMLRHYARRFAKLELEPQALERDEKEFFDLKLLKKLGPLGFLGLNAPPEYGGSGMDATAAILVHEELSAADPGFTLAFLAHSILTVNNIAHNGNEEQKERYLPKLCSGEWIGAMAMSEPEAGTDVLGMNTFAKKADNGYIINGRKMWITNGALDDNQTPADVLFLYAKTSDDHSKRSLSSFIIDKSHKGYSVGQKIKNKLGMRASTTAELVFEDCLVPMNQLVGTEGDATLHMMRNLEIERLTLAAMALGIMRRSLEIMNTYANERKAFGVTISDFGQIKKHIAESYAKYKACRSYIYEIAYHADLSRAHGRLDSDAAKLIASTMAKEIADSAIQVLGGYGYVGEYVVERLWRDAKLLEIGGGTVEAHQKNIADELKKRPKAIFE